MLGRVLTNVSAWIFNKAVRKVVEKQGILEAKCAA